MPFQIGRRSRGMGGAGGIGCSGRMIMAVVILLVGAMSYYFSTQKNPITNEEQRVGLTPPQEVALGLQAAPEMAQQMGGVVPREHPDAQRVSQVGQRLAAKLPQNPYRFEFHLLADSRTVNAFALPGGQIFITHALMARLQNEAQLAGVLGHEIGHVVHRHGAEHMATAQFYQSIVTATGVGTGDARAAQLAHYVSQVRQLKYGRDDEHESDKWGLQLMSDCGYDPREMVAVMKILKEASGGHGGSEMMSSHPLPESRIKAIEEWIAEHQQKGGMRSREPTAIER